jgi:hypothetical protein
MVPSTPVLGLYFPEDVSEENLKENIIDYFLISPYAYDCEPHLKDSTPDGLLIIQIKSYLNAGATIVADVIMLWIVPK